MRLGRKLGDHIEVSVGVEGHVLAALSAPRWNASQQVATGSDGAGSFPADALAGSVVIVLVPNVGITYEFCASPS